MKSLASVLLLCMMAFAMAACGAGNEEPAASSAPTPFGESAATAQPDALSPSDAASPALTPGEAAEEAEPEELTRRVSVRFGESVVVYALNDSAAADSLYEQLPLTVQIEDYSTNEKIFYPPEELDIGAPLAQGGAGTLAYYAPWGDVVMFYGDYSENSSLYELGQAVSGEELVSQMAGTVTIEAGDRLQESIN